MKCENCGANLKTNRKAQFCPYCGTSFGVEESDKFRFGQEINPQLMEYQAKADQARKEHRTTIGIVIGFLVIILLCFSIVLIPNWSEDAHMNQLSKKVQQLIIEGDYGTAAIEVEGIRVEKQGLFDGRYRKYENLRNDLKKLIEQKKRESGK